jgi:hypothetical protein
MLDRSPQSGRVPANLRINHGSVSLLGRFFLMADTAARDRGVTLYFASLQELVDVNRANPDSWMPLLPLFDPELGGVTAETGFVILGRDKEGEVVATQAARFYDWTSSTLFEEARSLRMFYAAPETAVARGDRCEIAAPVAAAISGRVVFSGAGWYRRDYRKKGLARILPRISRAYAFTRWNADFTISFMGDGVLTGGMAERAGYTMVAPSCVDFAISPTGTLRCNLVWMPNQELVADLETVMASNAIWESESRAVGM